MAQAKMKAPSDVVERNIRLTGEIMQYLSKNPQVLESLPDRFDLVILPQDDPEIRLYNLDLLDRHAGRGKPIVIARLRLRTKAKSKRASPSLFVPAPQGT